MNNNDKQQIETSADLRRDRDAAERTLVAVESLLVVALRNLPPSWVGGLKEIHMALEAIETWERRQGHE